MTVTIPKWFTVLMMGDAGTAETGPIVDSWEHPFNCDTEEEALEEAKQYYRECGDNVWPCVVRPSTFQEVIDFLTECYGPGSEDNELPF